MSKPFLMLLALSCSLLACESAFDVDEYAAESERAGFKHDVGLPMSFGQPGVTTGRTSWEDAGGDEAMNGFIAMVQEADPSVLRVLDPRVEAEDQDLSVARRFLADNAGRPGHHVAEQMVAASILLNLFPAREGQGSYLDVDLSSRPSDVAEAADFAVRLLLKNENPNADLIAQGLSVVGARWTTPELSRAKATAVSAATSWAASVCGECERSRRTGESTRTESRVDAVLEAAEVLRD